MRNLYECPVYKTRARYNNNHVEYILSVRTNIYLDIQPEYKGKTIQVGSGWGGATSPDLAYIFNILIVTYMLI